MSWSTPRTWITGDVVTAAGLNLALRDQLNALAPTGSYMHAHRAATAVETLVNGAWLEINGVAVSRATYATLFGVIGTTYGAGDGSTTFNLPAAGGRVLVAQAGAGGHTDVTTLGGNEGMAIGSRRMRHKHTGVNPTVNAHSHGGGNHSHTFGRQVVSLTPGGTPYSLLGDMGTHDVGTDASGAVIAGEAPGTSGMTIGVQTGAEPVDGPAYLVSGVWLIKT